MAAREAALRSAEQAEAQVARQPVVAAQATGSSMPAEGSVEPEWSSCASSEGDRVIEFGEQLAAQWTVQAQQQQQELAEKVLAAQAESAERHRGEVASVKSEFDQELDRMGRVTREVASSAHKGLVTALEVAAGTDKKVSSLEEVLRSQVSSLQGILDQTLRQQNTMAQRMEGWMQAQSAQQVSMLQQSKLFAEQKAQAASEATQQMLLSVVQSSEEKLQAFQQKIEQQAELVEGRRAAQEAASAEARTEAARQATRLAREQQEAMQQAAARQAEALAQQAAAQQAVAVAQEAAAQEVAAQRAAAQQAAAQQVADQQAAVQQAAAQQAAAQQAAQALTQQQQQAQHGGQHWQQQHQCGGQSQMQGGAGGAGGPPAPGGQVCIICQRSPVDPVSGLCAVCLHQRDGVLGGSPRCSISGCINLAQPGATLCAVHLGGPAQTGPQQQPHQQPQAAAGEDQLAAIFRQNAEQTRELKQMVLTMATQQYTAAQELKKASSKPKDSAKFSTQAQEIWIKLRALFDHAGTNQVRVAPSAVGLTGEELYQEMMVMASDAAVNDSFKYTQSLAYHVTEFLMGGNVNTGVFHPLQLMDFLQRKHMASYRGKRGQQVWTMDVTKASVKRLEPKPTSKWTRAEVQSAFEELGMFLARLIGEPAQKMVQDAFQMLDGLFDEHRRDRDVVDWTYLAGVGDLLLCKWCQELRRWAAAGVRWDPDRHSVEFAHWFGLPDPVPVIAVPLEDPWFDQNVGDILYQMLKRGKPAVDKWLKGMGSVDEVELEAEQGPQQPAAMLHSQQQASTVSAFPQLGQAWAVGGVGYEVLALDEVDPEEEGYVLLPASGGQPARAVTMQRVRFCTDQRLGVCKLGDKCPRSHDPEVMAKENEATKGSQCHAFAADGTCRFGKNCRFSHGAADFR